MSVGELGRRESIAIQVFDDLNSCVFLFLLGFLAANTKCLLRHFEKQYWGFEKLTHQKCWFVCNGNEQVQLVWL